MVSLFLFLYLTNENIHNPALPLVNARRDQRETERRGKEGKGRWSPRLVVERREYWPQSWLKLV
jgi:hypothetical protein